MILALDPATATGVCHESGLLETWTFGGMKAQHRGRVLHEFRQRLLKLHYERPYSTIAAEDASFGSPSQAVKAFHNQLRGVIFLVAYELGGLPVVLYKPASIKKFATGNGRAGKGHMIAAAKRKLNLSPADDNQADAAWILQMARAKWSPGDPCFGGSLRVASDEHVG